MLLTLTTVILQKLFLRYFTFSINLINSIYTVEDYWIQIRTKGKALDLKVKRVAFLCIIKVANLQT